MTTEDFSRLSVAQRLVDLPDAALVECHAAHTAGGVQTWRARIAWPSDLPREHQVLSFTHATRPTREAALQACAGRIRARSTAPTDWGLTVLELGRLLLYWEFRAHAASSDPVHKDSALTSPRAVLDDLLAVLEANTRLRAEIDGFCPGLVERLRQAADPAS